MKKCLIALLAIGAAVPFASAVPPAEKLLPRETIAVLSVPDAPRMGKMIAESPSAQLWRDPAMKAFRDKFLESAQQEFLGPLERDLGVRLTDYLELAQGQITLALVENVKDRKIEFVLLMDSRDQSERLASRLSAVKQKWVDSGRAIKVDRIHNIEFTSLIASGDALSELWAGLFKGDSDPEAPARLEVIVGQVESLLIAGSSADVIESVLVRQGGSLAPSLEDLPAFEEARRVALRNADMLLWVNPGPLVDRLTRTLSKVEQDDTLGINFAGMIPTLGIDAVRSVAASFRQTDEGAFTHLFIGAPQSQRKGILKLFETEAREATPPAFVPADAVKFSRWRLDLRKTWTNFEAMLVESFPEAAGAFKLIFDFAGKDQDPNFDLRRNLIGNLGDDIITYQKAPEGTALEALSAPPSLFLISSPNADHLARAIRIALSSLGPLSGDIREREFRGRIIYSLAPPEGLFPPGAEMPAPAGGNFAASAGYLAFSSSDAVIEEFIRSSEGGVKPLRDTAGLRQAGERVGGTHTGFFGFSNDREEARFRIEGLKKSGDLSNLYGGLPFGQVQVMGADWVTKLVDWSLLPSFEAVARYFHFSVHAGGFDADGFHLRHFQPTPPQAGN
jgi:hypothetical protein